jgi:hypothetical protein
MGFFDVAVIVAGALDGEAELATRAELDAFVAGVEVMDDCSVSVEVFAVWHGHASDGGECVCVQFETDHHPVWSNAV